MLARVALPCRLRACGAVSTSSAGRQWLRSASALAGPDAPSVGNVMHHGQPRWPASTWHDHLQYHFFFDGIFVQARSFLTPSLEQHSVWIYDHAEGKVQELLPPTGDGAEPDRLKQSGSDCLELSGQRLQIRDGPEGGTMQLLAKGGSDTEIKVDFVNKNIFSWLPAGQGSDAVIHRPNLELELTYKGKVYKGHGYSKRYYGSYGPHWGYRFIQASWLGDKSAASGRHFLWTADATFRLGDGEAKYNYFKLLDAETGELTQAESKDTYQQDTVGYAEIDGEKYTASVEPLAEWCHDYKAGETNSRMQLRYCKVSVSRPGKEPLEGYALNERCFGVLG